MIRRAASLLLLALAACGVREQQPAPKTESAAAQPAPPPVAADTERDNLLNLAYGACAVSRTSELNLEASAAHLIDGLPSTRWASPPGGTAQTLVYSLGARTRVTQLGVIVPVEPAEVPKSVRFSASNDGTTWREVLVFEPRPEGGRQLAGVTPFETQYIRVEADLPGGYYTSLGSVLVLGEEVAPPQRRSITGCWEINGMRAQFVQQGARVTGIIHGPTPTWLEGGFDGRVVSLMWLRGATFGYAVVTLSPDGNVLSGLTNYEELSLKTQGEGWFGTRCDAPLAPAAAPVGALMARAKRWSLYGLAFDPEDRLDTKASRSTLDALTALLAREPSHRFRVVAHELREAVPEDNRRHCAARIESLRAALQARGVNFARVELVAAGEEGRNAEITSALQRLLASAVTIERLQ